MKRVAIASPKNGVSGNVRSILKAVYALNVNDEFGQWFGLLKPFIIF